MNILQNYIRVTKKKTKTKKKMKEKTEKKRREKRKNCWEYAQEAIIKIIN